MDRKFTIEVEQDEDSGWFVATVLELPGCFTQAPDMAALHANVYEAIALYLEVTEPSSGMPASFTEVWHETAVA